jgi:hypothetical protein
MAQSTKDDTMSGEAPDAKLAEYVNQRGAIERPELTPAPEPKPLVPLTPAETGRLAELRATPERTEAMNKEMAELEARMSAPAAAVVLPVLSAEEAKGRMLSAMEEIHAMLSSIVAAVPALGGARYALDRLRAHIASLRAE